MTEQLFIRIDNRLLHGQVVQFWLPHLEVERLIIANDEVAQDASMVSVYKMAIPKGVTLEVTPVADLAACFIEDKQLCTLVIVSDVFDIVRGIIAGFDFDKLTIGNVHASKGRNRVTDCVHLTDDEVAALVDLKKVGHQIDIQTFPGETIILSLDDDGGAMWKKH